MWMETTVIYIITFMIWIINNYGTVWIVFKYIDLKPTSAKQSRLPKEWEHKFKCPES